MTIEKLYDCIRKARWFDNLGKVVPDKNCLCMKNYSEWEDFVDMHPDVIRLPSVRDEPDPIYRNSLKKMLMEMQKEDEFRTTSLDLYKILLVSLRNVDYLFKENTRDFAEPAKGSALYAFRSALAEILISRPGQWCKVAYLYCEGHWPLGIMQNGTIVVL